MAKLSMYLPPFASDYSGACSALFGLNCLVIVIDAGCCTRNYVEYDELRWRKCRKSTFSAQLRTLDAVLGDDARILDQTIEAVEALHPSCVALVGTPVPAIVGMDVRGMAREVECRCGMPAFGLPTTGFNTYEHGTSLALEALCRRFAGGIDAAQKPLDDCILHGKSCGFARPRVNVLGATPHDFMGEEHLRALEECVLSEGFDIAWSTTRPYGLGDVSRAAQADASLVVSWSGLAAARFLRDRFGVPFAVGSPVERAGADAAAAGLRAAIAGKGSRDAAYAAGQGRQECSCAARVLIVGEHVAANALRSTLRARFLRSGKTPTVSVASFFSMEPSWIEPGDFQIESELDLVRYGQQHPEMRFVGDPLLRRIPGFENAVALELPHEAVSSTLFARDAVLPGADMDRAIERFVECCIKA